MGIVQGDRFQLSDGEEFLTVGDDLRWQVLLWERVGFLCCGAWKPAQYKHGDI